MPDKPYEDVQIEGHLIDSLMMPQIMDHVMDLDGEFEMLTFEVGRMKDDPSHAVMRIFGRDAAHLDELLTVITEYGVVAVKPQDVVLEAADRDGVFPDRFYSTTNLDDLRARVRRVGPGAAPRDGLRHPGRPVDRYGRDRGDERRRRPATSSSPATAASACCPLERPRESQPFEFMASAVSSEKPKAQIVREVAAMLREVKADGQARPSPSSARPSCTPERRRTWPA